MASGPGGIDRDEYIQETVHGRGQREDSNAAIPSGAPSSVAAERSAGASSSLPPSAPPTGEQGAGGGRDAGESSSAAAGADRKGKNVAAAPSSGSSSDEQAESQRARRSFLSKILNCSKNEVLCRKGFNQSSTGSLSNELSKGPHVAQQTLPFSNAFNYYREQLEMIYRATGVLVTKGVELCEHYSQFRTVEGDGECFYRSFIFSYLEQVLDRQDTNEEHHLLRAVKEIAMEHELLGWTSNFSRSREAFEKLVKKVMSWKTQFSLNPVASTNSYRKQKLLNFFSTYARTENIFVFLRLVAAIQICSDREEYAPYILELGDDCNLQDWCSRHVTPPGAVADHIQIRALATALGVPLRVQRLSEGAGQDICSGVSPVLVTLLLAYNHYDIIYPKMGTRHPRILALRHNAYTSRPRRLRDSIDISTPKRRRPRRLCMIPWAKIVKEWPEDATPDPPCSAIPWPRILREWPEDAIPDSRCSMDCKQKDCEQKIKYNKEATVLAANVQDVASCLQETIPELTTVAVHTDGDLATLDPETTRVLLPSDLSSEELVSLLKRAYMRGFEQFVSDDAFRWALLHSLYGAASKGCRRSSRRSRR